MQKTIVVAEDSPIVSKVVENYLIREGYAVCAFANGRDALLYIQQNVVDLLITDLEMPELDGWGLVEQVRTTVSDRLPVIVMSDLNKPGLVQELIDMGVSSWIPKPFPVRQLNDCIKKLIVYNSNVLLSTEK